MSENPTATRIAVVLSRISRRLEAAEQLLLLVPSLAEGTLLSADLGFRPRLGYLALELQLAVHPRTSLARRRLAFWLARAGGWARSLAGMSREEAAHFREALAHCDLSLREVTADCWAESVRRVFSATGSPPVATPAEPELQLHVGGTGWHGFAFDPVARLLQVPSPLAPPAGDVLLVSLHPSAGPGERCVARATVVSVRRPADAAPGEPAGFTLALEETAPRVADLLALRCPPPGAEATTRAAPRFAVRAPARLASPAEAVRGEAPAAALGAYVQNLSSGGAFVRTAEAHALGERVTLHLRLPDGRELAVPSVVVHRAEHGVGVRFELDGEEDPALAAALVSLAGRRRRVLVVDDDALARRILSDAFAAAGFEVVTAADGDAGLREIVDDLFTLDAVVTDVHMPGLSGEALVRTVRQAGGESDLVLVAITASPRAELLQRLEAGGADAVVSKDAGAATAVAAVEAALRRRAAPPSCRARAERAEAAVA